MVGRAEIKLNFAAKALELGAVYGKNPVLGIAGGFMEIAALLAGAKKDALREGCRLEEQQSRQNPKGDSGTASPGEATAPKPVAGTGLDCHELFIPSPQPDSDPDVNGGRYVTVCLPIVLDLDGDGIEYRSLDAAVLVDPHGHGRFEYSA
jgi:hypothetical protein